MGNLGAAARRTVLASICLFTAASTVGCSLGAVERGVDGPALRAALEGRLSMRLNEAPTPPTAANLHNLTTVYSGRSVNERLLVVVFDTPEATVQLLGDKGRARAPDGTILRRDNVVVVYQRDRGTASRKADIEAALDAASAS